MVELAEDEPFVPDDEVDPFVPFVPFMLDEVDEPFVPFVPDEAVDPFASLELLEPDDAVLPVSEPPFASCPCGEK